jgi:hypothetical protein
MDDKYSFLHPFSPLEVQAAQKVMFIMRIASPRIKQAVMLTLDEYFETVQDLARPHLPYISTKGDPFLHAFLAVLSCLVC